MLKKIIALVGSGFLFMLGVVLALVLGIVMVVVIAEVAEDPVETAFPRAKTPNGVFILPLEGEIVTSEKYSRILARAVERPEIKAIVVAINSPGGGVGASEEIFRSIGDADKKKPVVCAMEGVAASGGLFSAMGCRKIVVNKGTLTGSIGVLMTYPTVKHVMDKVGVQMNVVKSGELKDVGSPFREPNPTDRAFLEALVKQSYEQFLDVVATSRKLDPNKVRTFADGRVILGEEALSLGLVDEIGGVARAAKIALEASGSTAEPELLYAKRRGGLSSVFDMEHSRISRFVRSIFTSQLLYRSDLM